MKKFIKQILRESIEPKVEPKVEYKIEHLDSYDGQHNYELGLYINGNVMGVVQYVLYDGELTVSHIEVREGFRRKSYGSAMMKYLKQKYQGEYKYVPSMKTTDGAEFKHKEVKDLYSL